MMMKKHATSMAILSSKCPTKNKNFKWQKFLYLRQPFPDNYTDEYFLSQLKLNSTVKQHSYFRLVEDFCLIVFYISIVMVVIFIFIGVYLYEWNIVPFALGSTIISILGYNFFLKKLEEEKPMDDNIKIAGKKKCFSFSFFKTEKLKPYCLLIFLLLFFSPVLKSLTQSFCSNTIWALSTVLSFLNIFLYDYSNHFSFYIPQHRHKKKSILSTNLSLANSIVLASRLQSNLDVFFFVFLAVQINILLPIFDCNIKQLNMINFHRFLMLLSFLVCCFFFFKILSLKLMVFWMINAVSFTFYMPFYFLFLQRYKREYQGPWDVANPKLNNKD